MSWPAARRPPISEYLLALAQPAMRMPSTETDDTARAKKMPDVEVGEDGVGAERHGHVDRKTSSTHDERRHA